MVSKHTSHHLIMGFRELLLCGSTWNVLVDLAIGELVDLVVVLVAHSETVGGVVDFCNHSQQGV